MVKILKPVYKYLLLATFLSFNANAMDFKETTDGLVVIKAKSQYPLKAFDSKEFIDAIDQKINFTEKSIVEMNMSNDLSVNSRILGNTLAYFTIRDIPLSHLNISNTNVRDGIIEELHFLLKDEKFKCLDISGTPAVETSKDFSNNPKIIFITKCQLNTLKKGLKKSFGKEVISRHKEYYKAIEEKDNLTPQTVEQKNTPQMDHRDTEGSQFSKENDEVLSNRCRKIESPQPTSRSHSGERF